MFRKLALVFAAIAGLLSVSLVQPSVAQAETITWKMKSNYKYKVQVEFYSQNRNHVWPGNGQAWGLNDDEVHEFSLACNEGEKICFGAWPTGRSSPYWGVGPDGKHSCKTCCAICGEGDPEQQDLDD